MTKTTIRALVKQRDAARVAHLEAKRIATRAMFPMRVPFPATLEDTESLCAGQTRSPSEKKKIYIGIDTVLTDEVKCIIYDRVNGGDHDVDGEGHARFPIGKATLPRPDMDHPPTRPSEVVYTSIPEGYEAYMRGLRLFMFKKEDYRSAFNAFMDREVEIR